MSLNFKYDKHIIIFIMIPYSNIRVKVLNATFNTISVSSYACRSVLLLEETVVPEENHQPVSSHWQTWSDNVVSSTPRYERNPNLQC